MDNLTHTLVGLALADSGLKRASRFGTATLVIGANLPDIDGLIYLVGTGTDALGFRRGWTHGVLAMVVLPLLLTAVVLAWDRIVGRRPTGPADPVHAGRLLMLATVGIWSHPLLDLLNVYGVRLLMPFSRRWFYGDALFIIDPWVWAALAAGILAIRRRSARAASSADSRRITRAARVALGGVIAYVLVMAGLSRLGREAVERQASTPGASRTLVAPVFATPFRWDVVRDLGGRYELGRVEWSPHPVYATLGTVSIGRDEPGVRAAAATHAGAAFLEWARFPRFETERRGDSIRVAMSDVRYAGPSGGGWASVTVVVPAEGR